MSDDPKDVNESSGELKVSSQSTQEQAKEKEAQGSQSSDASSVEAQNTAESNPSSEHTGDSHPSDLFNAKPLPRLQTAGRRSNFRWWPIIASLLAVLALITVSWNAYQQYLMQQNWQNLQNTLNQQIEQQTKENRNSEATAQSSAQQSADNQRLLNQQNQLIGQLREALTATQQRIRELSGRRNQDWMLAEAEYLIKLADYKISLEEDPTSAVALLKTADEKILAMGDNRLLELRQAIAQDIADLQLVVAPDITGLAAQLDALAHQIPQLSIVALEFEPLASNAAEPLLDVAKETFSWQQLYQNFLDDFVTIKDHSEPVKPLMTPEQRGNLNANIQLALQQAQIALLRGEPELYQSNLRNAQNWINEFFKADELAQAASQQLEQLLQARITLDLPRQLTAIQAIQAINQQRLYQWLKSSSAEDSNSIQTPPVEQAPLEQQP